LETQAIYYSEYTLDQESIGS
jgi:hypothetical protein